MCEIKRHIQGGSCRFEVRTGQLRCDTEVVYSTPTAGPCLRSHKEKRKKRRKLIITLQNCSEEQSPANLNAGHILSEGDRPKANSTYARNSLSILPLVLFKSVMRLLVHLIYLQADEEGSRSDSLVYCKDICLRCTLRHCACMSNSVKIRLSRATVCGIEAESAVWGLQWQH